MKRIKARGIEVIVYEPSLDESLFYGSKVIKDLNEFILKSDLIVTNRNSMDLAAVISKVFTRDIFEEKLILISTCFI